MAVRKGLGKGLDALFMDNTPSSDENAPETVAISEIEPNRNQPRKAFDDTALQELADSIREHGLLQPLLVRPIPEGGYQIVAGERRWRASRMAGLTAVPVIIRDFDDQETMELALIENLQRENLNAMEEAAGYHELMETYGMTQAEVAKSVGKSRSAIANTLRLLNLPSQVREFVASGALSAGHARAILAMDNEEQMCEAAEYAVRQGLNVREIEKMAKKKSKTDTSVKKVAFRDSYFDEMEIALREELHRKIKITGNENGGKIEIAFYSKEELADIAERLALLK